MKFRHFLKFLPLLVLGPVLAACNETSQPEQAAQVAVPCRCTVAQPVAPVGQPVQTVQRMIHRRHRPVASSYGYGAGSWSESRTWRESFWSSSAGFQSTDAGEHRCCRRDGQGDGVEVSWWIDGYGRRHALRGRHDRATRAGGDSGSRLDPWYGYDDDDGPQNGY